jgi:mycobactin lysine-N-oxygenase
MAPKLLAIVGLGPKGAAIAAKATALSEAGYDAPEIVIFEPNGTASAWSGRHGYSDGNQELCTLAERDVGYPYDRTFSDVAEGMFKKFSWHIFSVSRGIASSSYDDWVIRGRRPPLHRDFANYIDFVVSQSAAGVEALEVKHIAYDYGAKRWTIFTPLGRYGRSFDGVVITGSGVPLAPLPNANQRVLNGKTFWQNISLVRSLLDAETPQDRSIAIIGGGGTAAAVALWFIRSGVQKVPIHVIGRDASLYARVPSYFEDRLFSDSSEWALLAPHVQDAFIARLTRGVVWNSVLQSINNARNLAYMSFSARAFSIVPSIGGSHPDDLVLQLDHPPAKAMASPTGSPVHSLASTVFVDARGFDAWWFKTLLLGALQTYFDAHTRDYIIDNIDNSLAIQDEPHFPRGLHVPMIASRQGPAAPNLMALGWMSDAILRPYLY